METTQTEVWSKSKLLIKGGIIGILTLFLMIPAIYVQSLIKERENRQKEAIAEVSQKWAGKQSVKGPVLVVPFLAPNHDTTQKTATVKKYAYFLPEELVLTSKVKPQEKHRGIYKVMLYNADVHMKGYFERPDLAKLNIDPTQVLWKDVFVSMHLSDVKGLNEELKLRWNNGSLSFAPNPLGIAGEESGMTAKLPLSSDDIDDRFDFEGKINLNGSEQLLFVPVGKITRVSIISSYPHPSFTGDMLPQPSEVKDSGFTATWTSLSHKRRFPQQFILHDYQTRETLSMDSAAFGVNLFVPVNAYQKTMRSVKYAILCIALTFVAFFLIETINRKSVHPFQYGLIGIALVLFYTLLLSFSEYIGFNPAYGVASFCTIGLISWFVKGILQSGKLSTILSLVLVLVYGYVFSILQLQDYSLLLGSVGLFITLAIVMYFSRRFQW